MVEILGKGSFQNRKLRGDCFFFMWRVKIIHDIKERKSINMIRKNLISWVILKLSLRFNKKTHEFVNDNITCFLFKSYFTTDFHSKIKTVHMLLKPVKLLKTVKVRASLHHQLPVEGNTIYTQVMLHWMDSPAKHSSSTCTWPWDFHSGKNTRIWPKKLRLLKISVFSWNIFNENTRFFYKQHFYKQRQSEIGKKSSKRYSHSSSTFSSKNNRTYSKK